MAIALLIGHPSEQSDLVSLGFRLARQLDKPIAILCLEANSETTEGETRFLNRTSYADGLRLHVAEVSKAKINGNVTAAVIEISSELKGIRDWLLKRHATEILGSFSIEALFVPRMRRVDDRELQIAKDALFSLSPCETIYLCVNQGEREEDVSFNRVGYLGGNRRERKIARRFARRLNPTQLVETTAEQLEPDLDGIVIGVFGPSATTQITKGKFWKTVFADAANSTVMVVNRADSRFDRVMLRIDDATRAIFADYQMTRSDRERLARELQAGTKASPEFILFMIVATSLACIGLLQSSPAVIIGAMLVAPLMTPLLGAGLSLIQGNLPLLLAAFRATLIGVVLSFLIGAGIGCVIMSTPHELFLDSPLQLTNEMIARSHPNLLDPLIGLAAGLAGGFAIGRDKKVGAIAGIAIAAALVPPIATAGLEAAIAALAATRHGSITVIGQLVTGDPEKLLREAGLLDGAHKPVAHVRLIIAPLMLFLMNACTVVIGAFIGLRLVGMHRTRYPRKSRRWVVAMIILLISAITYFLFVAPVLTRLTP